MEDSITKLTILHSNDMHGDFLPKTVGGETGGLVRLSGYINKIRKEKANTLYVVAGDMFRGSIIDQEYEGLSTIDLMNNLRPDVATIGNHEVDYGLAHLLFLEKCARFPIINADLYVTMNSARLFKPYLNVEVGGLRQSMEFLRQDNSELRKDNDNLRRRLNAIEHDLAALRGRRR